MIFFLAIKLESRAPCQNEVKRRLRTKALRWRKRDYSWWRETRRVRKSLHKLWGLWSIWGIPMKEKKWNNRWKQLAIRIKITSRVLSSESTREGSNAAGSSWREEQLQTHRDEREYWNSNCTRRPVLGASKTEFQNMRYTNNPYMNRIFQFLQKLGMSASDSTFSMQACKTNVLIW